MPFRKQGPAASQNRLHPHSRRALALVALLIVTAFAWLLALAMPAFAGHASVGDPLFYPCTSCHPVTPGKVLPNAFKGHQIVLESHDKLGKGDAACLACHDDPARDPGKLKLVDGTLVDITGDVSQVCYRCHEAKYKEFKAGEHGRHQASCVAAGCHDPHTPAYVYASPVRPFMGTGFTVRAVSDRQAFVPMGSPPVAPPVSTPSWLILMTTLGVTLSAGIVGTLIVGRPTR